MGIERFFNSIKKNDITNFQNKYIYSIENKIDATHLLLDYNSIIHVISAEILHDFNYLLYRVITNDIDKKSEQIIDRYSVINKTNTKDYKTFLNSVDLESVIIDHVKLSTQNIITNMFITDNLESVYIGIDGVPHKSKMMEQRNRRYMGTFIDTYKNKIFNDYKDKLDKNRILYENNKFSWSKVNITPGTTFINKIEDELNDSQFINSIKKKCKNLQHYKVSGTDEFGEAEKKIINYVHASPIYKKNDNITIYSPDADLTILGLLLTNFYKNIKILRYDQQEIAYNIIDVLKLRMNIYNYVVNNLTDKSIIPNEVYIINDVVFIFSIFGNDFIPKIESFNIRYDFEKLLKVYIKTLHSSKNFIIDPPSNNYHQINQTVLVNFFKYLHQFEGKQLQSVYMDRTYRNYNYIRNVFMNGDDTNDFNYNVIKFLNTLKTFNRSIINGTISYNYKNPPFIKILKKLTLRNTTLSDTQFVKFYIDTYKKNKRFPRINISLQPYSKSANDYYHQNILGDATEYDKEIYKLNNMLDEYKNKLNNYNVEVGKVNIDIKSYILKTENIIDGIKNYYNKFFGINDISIKNDKMKNIVSSYLDGLVWVFDYYYNDTQDNNPSVWYYEHDRAPLLTQIYQYIKMLPVENLNNRLEQNDNHLVDPADYFTPIEHFLFVTPIYQFESMVPIEYKKKLNEIKKYHLDVNNIVKDTRKYIDCRNIRFLNKCLVNFDIFDYNKQSKFIQLLRKN